MPEKTRTGLHWPADFDQRLAHAKQIDQQLQQDKDIEVNCLGFALYMLLTNQCSQEKFWDPNAFDNDPRILTENTTLITAGLNYFEHNYDLQLAAKSHLVWILRTAGEIHEHIAIIHPQHPEYVIHRPDYRCPVEDTHNYESSFTKYLQRNANRDKWDFQGLPPYFFRFLTVNGLVD